MREKLARFTRNSEKQQIWRNLQKAAKLAIHLIIVAVAVVIAVEVTVSIDAVAVIASD